MDRRTFVTRAGGALLGAPLLGPIDHLATLVPPRRPLAPGIQLYSVRERLARDFDGTLGALARMGYREVEFANWFGRRPAEVRRSLGAAGLTAPASHVELPAFRRDPAALCAAHAEAGIRTVVIAWMDPVERRTLDDWRRRADECNAFGEAAKRAGLAFAYHNHDYEFVPIGGAVPFELFATRTDPSLVRLELDLFWLAKAGQDPVRWVRRWPGRVTMMHVKDRARDGSQTVPGRGTLPLAAQVRLARDAGLTHAFVEHDEPADPMAFAYDAIKWFRRGDVGGTDEQPTTTG